MHRVDDLPIHLERWASGDPTRAPVAGALLAFASAAVAIAELVRKPNCSQDPPATRREALEILQSSLHRHAQVFFGDVPAGPALQPSPGLAAIVQPLTNHDKLDFNGPLGTIVSLVPVVGGDAPRIDPRGRSQRAAAIVSYGARTDLALTVGEGTWVFDLDAATGRFVGTGPRRAVPPKTNRYALNTAHQGDWNIAIRDYVSELLARNAGPIPNAVTLHWTNSLVLETFQVLTRGGVCMYPSEGAAGCNVGCVSLVSEANPIAFLVEQAGGRAINSMDPILDLEVGGEGGGVRTPRIFGAREEVDLIERYCRTSSALGTHSPLFGTRGFFRP